MSKPATKHEILRAGSRPTNYFKALSERGRRIFLFEENEGAMRRAWKEALAAAYGDASCVSVWTAPWIKGPWSQCEIISAPLADNVTNEEVEV